MQTSGFFEDEFCWLEMLFISDIIWYPSKLVNCVIIFGKRQNPNVGLRELKTKENMLICYSD